MKIFVRTSKGIRPTRNGAVFIGHLKKLMTDYQRAKNELWDCENLKGGRVTLGISSFRGRRILPIILKRFYEKYPDVQVDVVEENIMKLEDLLLDGQLDLAVVAMPSAKLKREITFLKKDEIFIVTNRNHSVMEIAHRREHTPSWWIDLKDAAKFKFILSDHTIMLGTISKRCKEQLGIGLEATDSAKEHLIDKGYDDKYGARPLRRTIQNLVEDRMAEEMLDGSIKAGSLVEVGFDGEKLTFTVKAKTARPKAASKPASKPAAAREGSEDEGKTVRGKSSAGRATGRKKETPAPKV